MWPDTLQSCCSPFISGALPLPRLPENGGSAFAALVFVPTGSLSWQGETQTFSHSADSGATMTKHFCSNCGSQLFGTNSAKPDRIHIKVGTMDDAQWFQPQCNVWANSRLPSAPVSPEVKDFATMPAAPAKI